MYQLERVEACECQAGRCWNNSAELSWVSLNNYSLFESRIWEKGCSSGLSVSLCVASTPKCTICFWIESGRTVILSLNKLVVSLSMSHCWLLVLYTALVYCCAATKDFKPMQRTITLKIIIFIASFLLPLSPIKFQLHIIGIPTGASAIFFFTRKIISQLDYIEKALFFVTGQS